MNSRQDVTQEIDGLKHKYLMEVISLNSLVHSAEAILETSAEIFAPEKLKSAMNRVYILEEINAVVLDERRQMSPEERAAAVTEVQRLASIVKED
jgi:hypothetical protein